MDGEPLEGWRKVLVGTVARVETGGTPSRSKPEYWGGAIRWMSSGEVKAKRVSETAERITEQGLRSSNAKVFAPGTVMVAMNGQGRTRGSVAYLDVGASCNQSLAAITPGDELSSRFLYQNLDTRYDELRALTGDDARSGLNLHLIRSLPLLLPPLTEQCSIACVLDAIDEAIEKTAAVIAATADLRKALLQELLTRGVPGWHTEWKAVPGIGTIPACWEVVRLGDVAKFTSGLLKRTTELHDCSEEHEFPVFGGNGISGYTEFALVERRVVVVGRVGQKCGSVHVTRGPAWITDNALYNVSLREGIEVDYLGTVLGSAGLNGIRNRNDLPLLTQAIVHRVQLAIPSTPEQQAILRAVAATTAREAAEERQRAALRDAKAVASDALLSGRVRVPVAVKEELS